MSKQKTIFICQECGATSHRWQGQCYSCNQWNTLVEEIQADPKKTPKSRAGFSGSISKVTALSDIKGKEYSRTSTSIAEFDRVLGGKPYAGVQSGIRLAQDLGAYQWAGLPHGRHRRHLLDYYQRMLQRLVKGKLSLFSNEEASL